MLSPSQIDEFVERGHVRVPEAIPRQVALRCRDVAVDQLGLGDRTTWDAPVVRGLVEGGPITEAASSPRLVAAVAQLLRGERHLPRPNLGLFVVRLPSDRDPADTGWHVDASFEGPATEGLSDWYVNHRSRGRGLLLLCLLSEVGVDDAPTRIFEGSHWAVPRALEPFGDDGVQAIRWPVPAPGEPVALATGDAGDVHLCHPFLVHAASWPHRGTEPRVVAQPPISLDGSLRLDAPAAELSVVASTVRRALDGALPER